MNKYTDEYKLYLINIATILMNIITARKILKKSRILKVRSYCAYKLDFRAHLKEAFKCIKMQLSSSKLIKI